MQDFELPSHFYLGKKYDLSSRKRIDDQFVLYDSKDLVTHAVCVGMTGSGKTGLCINLLEEAAIDGIPAIVIDPKGDLGNILLAFPDLSAAEFRPWINEEDAERKKLSPDEFAQQQADLWKKGLEGWGQPPTRIKMLQEKADFTIYTPGSNAGIPVAVLKSFAAPNRSVLDDAELLQDQIRTTATSVLGLIGVDADPVQSREHILISTLLSQSWRQGKDIDLGGLIQQIQAPPIEKIGVLDLESFFPSKERFSLAMKLNNLLAAPGFENWLNGEALDIGKLLYTGTGKPRISIFSISHLSDAERMFFVSILLNQILGWTRAQSGTTSLRAIIYMDEIFGYFPPVQNPPSKLPLLTLLKQARAFGVGVMLATQNPVDLDYKGLANAGTWFIGRLQTERDKMRVLDGLEGAAAGAAHGFDRARMEQILAGLGSRVFLMNNAKEAAPVVFETRWALSYLRGPMTRNQIKTLMDKKKEAAKDSAKPQSAKTTAQPLAASQTTQDEPEAIEETPVVKKVVTAAVKTGSKPLVAQEIQQVYIPIRSERPDRATLAYRPTALGLATVYFNDAKSGVHTQHEVVLIGELKKAGVVLDWQNADQVQIAESDLLRNPEEEEATYASLPAAASQPKSYDQWKKSLAETLYRTQTMELKRSESTGLLSHADESERDFRIRMAQSMREERDAAVEKIRAKFATQHNRLEEKLRSATARRDEQQRQASNAKFQTIISFGSAILGAFLGRKSVSAGTVGKAATAARGVGRTMKESGDVNRAEESIESLQQQLADLDETIKTEVEKVNASFDANTEELTTITMRPKKSDIEVQFVWLAWAPYWEVDGEQSAAWEA